MMTGSDFEIDAKLIGDSEAVEARVNAVAEPDRDGVRHILSYLYLPKGPTSVTRDHKTIAEANLKPVEVYVFQWLSKRTDGKLKKLYGAGVLETVRRACYGCEQCGFSDVRALNLDRIEPEEEGGKPSFKCLCANCNTVAARAKEMAALLQSRDAAEAAKAAEEASP